MSQVRASHILIKHQGSRRPASWKDPNGETIGRTTKDAAIQQLLAIRERIASGELDFGQVAKTESHCSSARNNGRSGLVQPRSDAETV
ncbi:hypothetical protein CLOP_g2991 [Closterium sp. NIES-67]|nr:hypothetical protein CLOP_g2991 [Closterium sp. NIES-67]